MTKRVELIAVREYARRRGCTEGAVRRAVRDGRITLIDGRIDPSIADFQWSRNTRARVGSGGAGSGSGGSTGARAGRDADGVPGYEDARLRRETAEAELAELRLAGLCAELVRVDDVRAAVAAFTAGFRDLALRLPVHLAPRLAATTDQVACHDLLQDAIHELLAEASGASRAGTH